MNKKLLGIELFDLRLRQDIERSNGKNGAKGKIEQIESSNDHSTDPTRILILEEAFATDNGDKSIEKADQSNNKENHCEERSNSR